MRAMMVLATFVAFSASATSARDAEKPRVVLQTDAGRMVVELAPGRAPLTVCNFLSYVADGDYDGGSFFRTIVSTTNQNPYPIDVIQAATPRGSDDRSRPPIKLERTGMSHVSGTISMARDGPDTATSSFFIVTQDTPSLDYGGGRNPDGQGFAAFGRVIEGLDVARLIQMSPADDQEQLTPPVMIQSVRLLGAAPEQCGS